MRRSTTRLENESQGIKGAFYSENFQLEIEKKDQHFWSPHLNVTFEEGKEGTILRGRYGPKPTIWTIFLFGYVGLGLLFFFAAMIGLVQLSLHQDAKILWVLPILLSLLAILYFASQTGQKLGVEQTFRIHHFLEDTLDEKIEIK